MALEIGNDFLCVETCNDLGFNHQTMKILFSNNYRQNRVGRELWMTRNSRVIHKIVSN